MDTGDLVWTGELNKYIAMGGDFRAAATWNNSTIANDAFNTEQARVYLAVSPIPDRVTLYIDEQVAPDAAVNREAWAMFRFGADRWYLRLSHMTLAYGCACRISRPFRQIAGINMDTLITDMELDYRSGPWDAVRSEQWRSGRGRKQQRQAVHIQIARVKSAGASASVKLQR